MAEEWRRGEFVVSTDPALLDVPAIHRWLSEESYWAAGIPLDTLRRGVENSLNFGLHGGKRLAGYVRIITETTRRTPTCATCLCSTSIAGAGSACG